MNSTGSSTDGTYRVSAMQTISYCWRKKSWKKAKDKLRQLTSRSRCGSIVRTMEKITVYMRGWLNYYGIADMKNNVESLNGWL